MHTSQKALYIESVFSGPVSENLDIYGIMQGVSIFSLSKQVSVHVDANNNQSVFMYLYLFWPPGT